MSASTLKNEHYHIFPIQRYSSRPHGATAPRPLRGPSAAGPGGAIPRLKRGAQPHLAPWGGAGDRLEDVPAGAQSVPAWGGTRDQSLN